MSLGARPALPAALPRVVIVDADTRLKISETPLAADAGDFDGNEIPVHGSFVLVHRNP